MDGLIEATPRVSVIIVSFNKKELLREALTGLQRQSYRTFETIVVDNGSCDDSAELVSTNFPKVRLVHLSKNVGFAGGNNCGIAIARGEFIALVNNDATPDPDWLAELLRAAQSHPDAGFFASRVVVQSNPRLLDSAGDGITFAGTAFRRGHHQPASHFAREGLVFGASGSAAFYRRSVLDKIGFFDEDFFAVYEDVDLSFRAQLAGYKCLYVPTAIVQHRGSGTIGKYTEFYVYQTQRNIEFFFWKDLPAPLLFLLLPGHLVYNLLGFCFFALFKKRGSAFLRAKWHALVAWRAISQKRRSVQASRRVHIHYLASMLECGWIFRTVREKLG